MRPVTDAGAEGAEALAAALRRMGLVGARERPRFEPLTGGVSSDIYRVETAAGPICVKRALPRLKVAADWFAPVARNASEARWLAAVHAVSPGAAPRLLGQDLEAGALAMAWLEPETHPVWKAELAAGRADAGFAHEVGRRLAAIHRAYAGDAAAAAVPAEGLVFQMGVMGARDRPVMRLCTRNMDAEASLSWLARIGWPGDRTLLRRTVARLDPLCHDIALNVDILSDRVGPKLGVELYALSEADRRSLAMEPWRPLFDELLAQGLVRPDKLAVLADYPSLRMFRQYRAFRRKPPVGYPALATNLHHLKLVFAGDRAVEVKAYIGVYRPVIDYNRVGKMEIDGGDGWF